MMLSILDSLWKEIGSVAGFVGAGVFGYFIPKVSTKVKGYMQQQWFNVSLKKSVEIKIRLAELKAKIGAQRIYLLQFHNGKVFLGDNAFHKYSVSGIFEVVSQGLSREIQEMQNMPMSNYAELLFYMQKESQKIVVVGDHRGCDMTFDEADMTDTKYSTNATSIVFIKVLDKADGFIGLLVFYFDSEIVKGRLVPELDDLNELNSLLSQVKNKI